jgi:hypothetical protein
MYDDVEGDFMRKKWMIGIAAVLIVGVLGGFLYYQGNKGADTATLATGNFLIELNDKNFKNARKYLSSETNKIYTESKLEELRENFYGNGSVTLASPESIFLSNEGKAAVETINTVNPTDRKYSGQTIVTLVKTIFGWKIENIKTGF